MPTVNKLIEGLEEMQRGGHGETHVYFLNIHDGSCWAINSMSVENLADNHNTAAIVLCNDSQLHKHEDESYDIRKHLGDEQ